MQSTPAQIAAGAPERHCAALRGFASSLDGEPKVLLCDPYAAAEDFGCEIEMTGLTRQQAAEAVAALFGTTASHSRSSRTYDPWEVTDNEGKTWRFVFDASIRATHRSGRRQLSTGDDTYKVEMNSPKLEYSEMGKLLSLIHI